MEVRRIFDNAYRQIKVGCPFSLYAVRFLQTTAGRSSFLSMLHKNIRVEENAGLREATYQTFEFNFENTFKLMAVLFVPSFFIVAMMKEELYLRDKERGIEGREYGFWPPKGTLKGDPQY
eukprot:gene35090-43265_t